MPSSAFIRSLNNPLPISLPCSLLQEGMFQAISILAKYLYLAEYLYLAKYRFLVAKN